AGACRGSGAEASRSISRILPCRCDRGDRRVCRGDARGYTTGMKTAVSLPDDVFRAAERHARRARKSRSQLYAEALAEYLARRAPEEITEAMNHVFAQLATSADRFVSEASRRALARTEW